MSAETVVNTPRIFALAYDDLIMWHFDREGNVVVTGRLR